MPAPNELLPPIGNTMTGALIGYQPADAFTALEGQTPQAALFTTFKFSSGAFHSQ